MYCCVFCSRLIRAEQQEQLWMAIKSDVGTYRTTTRGSWASRARKWVREFNETAVPPFPFGEKANIVQRFIKSKYCLSVVFAHSSSFLPLFILFILVVYLCLCVALLFTGFVQSNEWMTLVMSVFGVKTWSFIEVNTLYQVTPLHNVYTTLINVVQR